MKLNSEVLYKNIREKGRCFGGLENMDFHLIGSYLTAEVSEFTSSYHDLDLCGYHGTRVWKI